MRNAFSDGICQPWEYFIETGKLDSKNVRIEIAESWGRCLFDYRLDPHAAKQPIRLSEEEIVNCQQKNSILIDSAKPFMKVLESTVHGSGFIITLAETEGYVLEVIGDEEIMEMARSNNYLPGCRRTEDEVGTNAIGLSLCLRKPIQVTGCEHFNVNHHSWTCSSSPIFYPEGELLGSITLSGRSLGSHQHTLGMVISAAKAIENEILEGKLSQEKNRLNSYLDSLLNSISEGIIAIKQDGTVTHINHIAEEMLGISKLAIIEKPVKKALTIPMKLAEEILGETLLTDEEISTSISGKLRSFILSTRPIVIKGNTVGKILTLSEKRRVYQMIHKFTGGNARFVFDDVVGKNPHLLRQIELAKVVARTDARILLVGESGTGKELFAQAIHNESKRRNGPFIAVSCGSIPRELIESELFGYREGAFTGARRGGQVGKFELADGGTLFLDEISSMPFEMQATILRVLQENEVLRLGDREPCKVDVRVIAATNKDLMDEVEHKNFRQDLYFRLSVIEITIPPLRERVEDIPLLIEHILKRIALRFRKDCKKISEEALQILTSYSWPGNIRELENCLERASLLCEGSAIKPEHLNHRFLSHPTVVQFSNSEPTSLKEEERIIITRALKECRGNISESARKLQISRSTLHRRIKILGLSSRQFR